MHETQPMDFDEKVGKTFLKMRSKIKMKNYKENHKSHFMVCSCFQHLWNRPSQCERDTENESGGERKGDKNTKW